MHISTPVIPWEVSYFLSGVAPFVYAILVVSFIAISIGFGVHYWDLTHKKESRSDIGCY